MAGDISFVFTTLFYASFAALSGWMGWVTDPVQFFFNTAAIGALLTACKARP